MNVSWNRLQRLFRVSALFASITYLNTAISIVQFSVITTLLSRDELGIYGIWMAVAMLTSTIAAWGIVPVGIRLAASNGNAHGIAALGAMCSVFISLLVVPVAVIVDELFTITKHEPLWLCFACIGGSLMTVREILFIPLHNKQLFNKIGLVRLVNTLLVALLSVYLVINNPYAKSIIFASLIVNAAIVLYLLCSFEKSQALKSQYKDHIKIVKKILKEGSPITVLNLSSAAFNRLDWIVLGTVTTPFVVGGYSVVYRLYEFSYQLTSPFTTMLYPRFCKGDIDWPKRLWKIRNKVMFGGASISIFAICLFPMITEFFWPGKFSDQYLTFIILMSGLPFIFMVGIMYQYYMSQGMQTYLLKISLFSMVTNTVLLLTLVPRYHAYGAAVATLIPQLIQYIHMARGLRRRVII